MLAFLFHDADFPHIWFTSFFFFGVRFYPGLLVLCHPWNGDIAWLIREAVGVPYSESSVGAPWSRRSSGRGRGMWGYLCVRTGMPLGKLIFRECWYGESPFNVRTRKFPLWGSHTCTRNYRLSQPDAIPLKHSCPAPARLVRGGVSKHQAATGSSSRRWESSGAAKNKDSGKSFSGCPALHSRLIRRGTLGIFSGALLEGPVSTRATRLFAYSGLQIPPICSLQ